MGVVTVPSHAHSYKCKTGAWKWPKVFFSENETKYIILLGFVFPKDITA